MILDKSWITLIFISRVKQIPYRGWCPSFCVPNLFISTFRIYGSFRQLCRTLISFGFVAVDGSVSICSIQIYLSEEENNPIHFRKYP